MAEQAPSDLPYEEFEPFCEWKRLEDSDVLQVHLAGTLSTHAFLRFLINIHSDSNFLNRIQEGRIEGSDQEQLRPYTFRRAPSSRRLEEDPFQQ